MQSFIVFTLLVTVATAASIGSSQQGVVHNIVHTLTEEGNINANAPSESARLKKSAYGSAPVSVPAPPCPKSYLFSCQPNIAPVPCAPAQSGYAGAYSAPVPTFAYPQTHGGIPQELLRQYY